MHSTEPGGNSVPAFLIKLWKLVEDPKYSELICWSPNGLSFIIHDQSKFAKEVLPLYFKHNNTASFIRQLNMYGFRKVMNIEQGGSKGGERSEVEFFHQFFVKGRQNLLEFIKRKVPTSRTVIHSNPTSNSNNDHREEGIQLSSDAIQEILSDMSGIKNKQEGVDSQLSSMKQENEALWREVAYLRQKHIKQQQIVDKLIHFLVSLVQPNRNIGVKRKLPLMLQDFSNSTANSGKVARLSRQFSNTSSGNVHSPIGPVIHDVTDTMTESSNPAVIPSNEDGDGIGTASNAVEITAYDTPPEVLVNSPLGTEEHMEPLYLFDPLQDMGNSLSPDVYLPVSEPVESSNITTSKETQNNLPVVLKKVPEKDAEEESPINKPPPETDMQVALSDNTSLSSFLNTYSGLEPSKYRSKFSDHLEGVESELAWLQEQLSNGSSFNFDSSALLGLFSSDDTVPGNNISCDPINISGREVTGNELTQYVPSLLDLELIDDELSADDPRPSTSNLDCLQTPDIKLDNAFENFGKTFR